MQATPFRFIGQEILEQPAVEPVSLDEAKLWLKVDQENDNDLIAELLVSARELAEQETGRAFINTKFQSRWSRFPDSDVGRGARPIKLFRAPVISVEQVTYIEPQLGPTHITTMPPAEYIVTAGSPGFVTRNIGWWPITYYFRADCVFVDYTAGYGPDPVDVPATAKVLIKELLQIYYDNRSSLTTLKLTEIPLHLQRLANRLSYGSYPD